MTETQNQIKHLRNQLKRVMHADAITLRRELERLARSRNRLADDAISRRLARLTKRVRDAVEKRTRRINGVPRFSDLPHLPITGEKDRIIGAIANHPVVIVSGETGSGKTTQIPKFCLAAGRGIDGKIACTQPRRIAATTVAARIAEELGEALGRSVGYKIRFQDRSDPQAFIKVVTDGILLAETQGDPWLNEYDTIIVDEAHERSLNIDFVLGILKRLSQRRRNLKLIITSATIDTEKFSRAFDDAPIIEVSGRLYPVETRYFDTGESVEEEGSYVDLAVQAADGLVDERGRGDILVFMPTEQDIRETCETLGGRNYRHTDVIPLFARLGAAAQKRVFATTVNRKIIVATNVAETSITIPGIKYVVDTGLARISQYMPQSRTTALPVVPISRSSADQRKGRCGRVEDGVCVRLYSEEDYLNRPLFTQPEILRSNLAEVILRMIFLGLGEIDDFPFIDRPMDKSIRDGFTLLLELGAIVQNPTNGKRGQPYRLTENGRIMARMPIDPRLSRMLIEARKEGCLAPIVVIAAALSIQDVRERPLEKEALADQAQRVFVDPLSDFVTLLNIWRAIFDQNGRPVGMGELKRFCMKHFLSFRRMREWRDIHGQIVSIVRELWPDAGAKGPVMVAGHDAGPSEKGGFHPLYTAIHRCVLSGFLSNIAMQKEKVFFRATKDREVMIFPGSGLFKNPGPWIVAAEMVKTSRLFARCVAVVDPAWLEPLGGELCKSTRSDPHWSRNRGEVVAKEQVTLFGLPIVTDRQVPFGRIDAELAADLFVRCALVAQDVRQPLAFMRHNAELVKEVRGMEDRIRRRDILVDDEALVDFYKKRLPGVFDLRTLKHRIRRNGGDQFLRLDKKMLLRYTPERELLDQFPKQLDLGHRVLDCDYAFAPGHVADGVTVTVPADATGEVSREHLGWLVPGLLEEKITTLLRGLAKQYRVQLVPVADTVRMIVDEMPKGEESLPTALSRFLYTRLQVNIPAAAWPVDELPDHLKMRVTITDAHGRVLASGRDESLLDQKAETQTLPKGMEDLFRQWEKENITQWDFGDLPESLSSEEGEKGKWCFYPRLEATEGGEIQIRLFSDRKAADAAHRKGVMALLSRHFADDLKFLKKNLAFPSLLKKQTIYFKGPITIENQLYRCVTKELFEALLLTEREYQTHLQSLCQIRVHQRGQRLRQAVIAVIEAHHAARCRVAEVKQKRIAAPVVGQFLTNLEQELDRLVPDNFVTLYDRQRLTHVKRYLDALSIRIQRGFVDLDKDRGRQTQVAPFIEALQKMMAGMNETTSAEKRTAVEEFFWMIEEYKVSVFAQEVGTDGPVSAKRLRKLMGEIERMI